jgi:hypothetical protein
LKISLGILTPAGNRPEKKKGKRKKADGESETANQKGKGAAGALENQFLRWRHLYTLAFLQRARNEPFAVSKLTRFFCFFSLSEGGAMVFQSVRWNFELGIDDFGLCAFCTPSFFDRAN